MRFWFLLLAACSLFVTTEARGRDPEPKTENVLHLALWTGPRTFDPQSAYDIQSIRIIEAVYDPLLAYDPFKTGPCELIPCLLEALPRKEVAADGAISYVCTLKRGLKFHDDPCFPGGKGREIVAADIAYTFQRLCDPKLESPFVESIAEHVVGMAETREQAAKNEGQLDYEQHKVSGVEILDAHTFRIRLKGPWPPLQFLLASSATCPVAREAVAYYDGKDHPPFAIHPVGTGAFQLDFAGSDPKKFYRLVRTPDYAVLRFPAKGWPAEHEAVCAPLAGRALPLLDEVHYHTVKKEAGQAGFGIDELGEYPLSRDDMGVAINERGELVAELAKRGVKLEHINELSTFYLAFNGADPIVGKNKKLRQALSCAYDRKEYLSRFNPTSSVANQLLPPGVPGHDSKKVNPYGYDLEKAKRLLAEAGYPEGRDAGGKQLELTLLAAVEPKGGVLRAEFEKQALEKLGISVTIERKSFAELLDKKDTGQFQIVLTGWAADYPDAENFFSLFHGKISTGGNWTRYANAEFATLFERMRSMDDGPEREKLCAQIAAILEEDCIAAPTFHKRASMLVNPWMQRTHRHPMLNDGLKYLAVDPARKSPKPDDAER